MNSSKLVVKPRRGRRRGEKGGGKDEKKGREEGEGGGEVIGQEKICYTKPATVALLRVESAVNQRRIMPLYFLTFWKALSHCLDDIVWFCAIVFHWINLVVIAESKVRVQVVWGVIELEWGE